MFLKIIPKCQFHQTFSLYLLPILFFFFLRHRWKCLSLFLWTNQICHQWKKTCSPAGPLPPSHNRSESVTGNKSCSSNHKSNISFLTGARHSNEQVKYCSQSLQSQGGVMPLALIYKNAAATAHKPPFSILCVCEKAENKCCCVLKVSTTDLSVYMCCVKLNWAAQLKFQALLLLLGLLCTFCLAIHYSWTRHTSVRRRRKKCCKFEAKEGRGILEALVR